MWKDKFWNFTRTCNNTKWNNIRKKRHWGTSAACWSFRSSNASTSHTRPTDPQPCDERSRGLVYSGKRMGVGLLRRNKMTRKKQLLELCKIDRNYVFVNLRLNIFRVLMMVCLCYFWHCAHPSDYEFDVPYTSHITKIRFMIRFGAELSCFKLLFLWDFPKVDLADSVPVYS